jgi:hypothetical protein
MHLELSKASYLLAYHEKCSIINTRRNRKNIETIVYKEYRRKKISSINSGISEKVLINFK